MLANCLERLFWSRIWSQERWPSGLWWQSWNCISDVV